MHNSDRWKALGLEYVNMLRLSLAPVGAWAELKQVWQPTLFNISVLWVAIQTVVVIGEVNFLRYNFGVVEFFLLGDVYISTFLTMLSLVRLSLPNFKGYYLICKRFFTEFHLVYFKHKGGSFKKIAAIVDKISHYYTILTISAIFIGIMLFNLSPLYVNYKNGALTTNRHNLDNITLEFTVRYMYPGYDQRDTFLLTTFVNFFLSIICSLSIIPIDLLLILMTFQIIGHLEILAMNMRSVQKPKEIYLMKEIKDKISVVYEIEMYDDEGNSDVKQLLKELIDHHRIIISFTDNVSEFFGPLLGCTYMFHLVSCCLLLLECSRGEPDVIVRFGPLTSIVFMELIQISVIFEVVGSKSEQLIDCVYGLPWQCMDVENRRTVSIMLCRSQETVHVTACGLAEVGVQTMANILKTTFSYFTFLQSM